MHYSYIILVDFDVNRVYKFILTERSKMSEINDKFFNFMKSQQDVSLSSSLHGQLIALKKLKVFVDNEIREVQGQIDETPTGKIEKRVQEEMGMRGKI